MQDHMHHHDDDSPASGTLTQAGAASAPAAAGANHGHSHGQHQAQHDDDHAVHTHGQHAGHSTAMFKNRFWLTLALSLPVVYFSPMVGHLLGYMAPMFPGSTWIPPVLGPVIFLYGGQPFLKGGLQELKDRRPGM
ncbi:MAG: copper/silver-translocating P-type ATPase, partial [Pseudarthrobacter sp.]|nr:copper/silver-translocating P-type ATPase [Pseudarthrobacter sp.]